MWLEHLPWGQMLALITISYSHPKKCLLANAEQQKDTAGSFFLLVLNLRVERLSNLKIYICIFLSKWEYNRDSHPPVNFFLIFFPYQRCSVSFCFWTWQPLISTFDLCTLLSFEMMFLINSLKICCLCPLFQLFYCQLLVLQLWQ